MATMNYLSDGKLRVRFVLNGVVQPIPTHDFTLRFRSQGNGTYYDCYKKGGELVNCAVDGDDPNVLVCALDEHGLYVGELTCEFYDYAPDALFSDGNRLTVTPCGMGLTLVKGAGQSEETAFYEITANLSQLLADATAVVRLTPQDGLWYTDASGNVAMQYTPAGGLDVVLLSEHFKNLVREAVRMVLSSSDGFYYADSDDNVAMRYTPEGGFDVAMLGDNIKRLVREAVRMELTGTNGFYYTDADGHVAFRYDSDGLDAAKVSDHLKTLLNS